LVEAIGRLDDILAGGGAAPMPTESIAMLRGVRQAREFQDRPVPEDALRDVLEVARWSGSSRNTQPWELIVIADRDKLRRLAEIVPYGKWLVGAPLGIVVVMHGSGQGQSLDAGRIAERIMIAAHARGLGAGLATSHDDALERQALALVGAPEGHSLGVALALGFPGPRDPGAPRRATAGRRPLGELVHYDSFGQRRP
jgi:nitroreductase